MGSAGVEEGAVGTIILRRRNIVGIHRIPSIGSPNPNRLHVTPRAINMYNSSLRCCARNHINGCIIRRPVVLNRRTTNAILRINPNIASFGPNSQITLRPNVPSVASQTDQLNVCGISPTIHFFTAPPVSNYLYRRIVRPTTFACRLPSSVDFNRNTLLRPATINV